MDKSSSPLGPVAPLVTPKMDNLPQKNEIVVYQPDETLRLDVRLEDETVWLSQSQMGTLFGCTTRNVRLHLENIYACGELAPEATRKDFFLVRHEGVRQVRRMVTCYNLDAIISVGYPRRRRPRPRPDRRVPQGPRQEVLRLHEDGRRGNPRPEGETVTPLAASVRVAGSRHAPEPRRSDARRFAARHLVPSAIGARPFVLRSFCPDVDRPPCGGISPLPRPAPAEGPARICCTNVAFARPGFVVDSSPVRAQRAKRPYAPPPLPPPSRFRTNAPRPSRAPFRTNPSSPESRRSGENERLHSLFRLRLVALVLHASVW